MEYVRGTTRHDNYLRPDDAVYRYHYYSQPNAIPIPPPTPINTTPAQFNINMNFGSSATLDPHRNWMISLESFNTMNIAKDVECALVIGKTGQVSERSNFDQLNGTSVVFNINDRFIPSNSVTTNYIGHKITNPNFLNEDIPCRIIQSRYPTLLVENLLYLQFTIVVYAYD
jgi:hypothetical protein